MVQFWNSLLSIRQYFFPVRYCPACGQSVQKAGLCQNCRDLMLELDRCHICAAFILKGEKYCSFCHEESSLPFSEAKAALPYGGKLRDSILAFKYYNRTHLARPFAYVLKELIENKYSSYGFDLIVPVPLSEKRFEHRGYNQSELLTKSLSKILGVPSLNILRKNIDTPPLSQLTRPERLSILKNAFIAEADLAKNKRILLIDDIFTTGATSIACAKALKKAGAIDIKVATIAAGKN